MPYPWEVTEVQAGHRRSIWLASIQDYGTGEGLTVHFGVSFAHDEDEFRRCVSLELGRELAHLADVRKGISEHPLAAFFLSQRARATLEAFDRGENPPGAVSFVVKYHVNYS